MMSEKKWNSIFVGIVVLGVLLLSNPARADFYFVGDEAGWKFNVAGWENGKTFKELDTLIFKYKPGSHNVVLVDKASYDSCTVPPNATTYSSGNDEITIGSGPNYFICGFPRHCGFGMKIVANAS
ncbi:basic blue protein-like [Salvia miltiorrhiza]|uniref:basic blue protein-like n=1 Tax=Salvia miltiorrhiza TaxID=226208 RepID=UPI0025AD6540|nr:basic blue protein-like [Salvia miltiorrhiza]